MPGESPLFPVLPDSNPLGNQFIFNNPTPGLSSNPPFAQAYTYTLLGGAEFTQFSTPDSSFGFGNLTFTDLAGANSSFLATAGTVPTSPTTSFTISGLPFGLIDFQSPSFATAFPAFLNWTGAASTLQIDVTPFAGTQAVPEPATWALLTLGLGALIGVRRRRR